MLVFLTGLLDVRVLDYCVVVVLLEFVSSMLFGISYCYSAFFDQDNFCLRFQQNDKHFCVAKVKRDNLKSQISGTQLRVP